MMHLLPDNQFLRMDLKIKFPTYTDVNIESFWVL